MIFMPFPRFVADAAAQLGLDIQDMDASFGVVPIDPSNHLYGVQVREGRVPSGSDEAPR
jgi:hypothetical protein